VIAFIFVPIRSVFIPLRLLPHDLVLSYKTKLSVKYTFATSYCSCTRACSAGLRVLHGLPVSVPLGFNFFFLLLFELAHRAFSRLRPRCRRPRTMRRPLASRATPALRWLPPSAVRPSFAVSAACLRLLRRRCEDCLRRLRRLLLPLCLSGPPSRPACTVLPSSFFVIPLLAYCSVIFLLRSGHLPMLGFPSAQIPLQWLLCCRSFVCSPRGS
jgi:hypothetical protein